MTKLARKRAELELLEAEAAFAVRKLAGEVTREDKETLRELRRTFREKYRQPAEGASPEPIATQAKET